MSAESSALSRIISVSTGRQMIGHVDGVVYTRSNHLTDEAREKIRVGAKSLDDLFNSEKLSVRMKELITIHHLNPIDAWREIALNAIELKNIKDEQKIGGLTPEAHIRQAIASFVYAVKNNRDFNNQSTFIGPAVMEVPVEDGLLEVSNLCPGVDIARRWKKAYDQALKLL